ncbi:ComEC/Rec2 family competence protein [Mycobacterium yunnanensis]|uniref:ComEC/Rec2 family competence protein n=1 Tax=Mycobacterium yunnanensis TaxID=368477 RepID=A0A9X2YRE8_9MYCO|nr:ComEC/Rec2 family competence protein [Mycobacterium yunnanensis]MCV7424093.1 ComEC/Rec2 family competence protein [Mycobacterium yunnanensis]
MTFPSVADGPDVRLVPGALTSWAVTAAGIVWGTTAGVVAVVAAVLVAAATRWRWRMPWPTVVAVAAVGVAFAVAVGLRVQDADEHPIVSEYGTTVAVVLTPTESPRMLRGARIMFRAKLISLDGRQIGGRVVVFASGADYREVSAGRPAAFRAHVSRPMRRDLSVAVLTATGSPRWGTASLVQRSAAEVRARFADAARSVLPGDQAAMLPALVLGDTSAVDEDVEDDFRAAGLTHLTAVSGANVTIVCGAVLLSAVVVGPRIAVGLAAVALIAFVVVVQPSASVLRASVMGSIALFAVLSRRRRRAIPSLSACVLVLLVVSPELAVDLGFALSVSATAALVVVAPVWTRRLVDRGWPTPVAAAVSVAVAAQLVTTPLVAGMSGTVSMVSVLANLVVAPVIAPITVIGTAAAVLTVPWPAAAELMIRFTGPELWWLTHVGTWAAAVPGAVMTTPSGWPGVLITATASVAAVVLWRWRRGRVAVVAAAVCLVAWSVGAA